MVGQRENLGQDVQLNELTENSLIYLTMQMINAFGSCALVI